MLQNDRVYVFCLCVHVQCTCLFLLQVIKEGEIITGDLGGKAKCSEFTSEIIRKIEDMK